MLWDCSMLCLAQGCKPASNLMMARQLSSWPFFSLPSPSPILLTPVSQEHVYNEGWRRELLRVQRVQNKVLACVSTTGLCTLVSVNPLLPHRPLKHAPLVVVLHCCSPCGRSMWSAAVESQGSARRLLPVKQPARVGVLGVQGVALHRMPCRAHPHPF